jgi:hypothetical protein
VPSVAERSTLVNPLDRWAGSDELAAELKSAVIAGADRDWFHNPERRPTRLPPSAVQTDECPPVGRLLLPDCAAMRPSARRAAPTLMIENEVTDDYHVARVVLTS